jgi:hypothetical protein
MHPEPRETNIINRFIRLILTERLPLFNPCPFLNIPLDDLDLRYPCEASLISNKTLRGIQCFEIEGEKIKENINSPSPTSFRT